MSHACGHTAPDRRRHRRRGPGRCLFAVFECGMVRLHCHVVDVLDDAGGQCTALYPEKPIYDIPGFPRIEAAELVVRLKAQAAPFQPGLSPRRAGPGARGR